MGFDDEVAQLLDAEVQAEYVDRYGGPDSSPMSAAEFAPPHGAFLVGLVDGEPVGCVGMRRVGAATAEVKRMFVRAGFRGAGYARALLAGVEDAAAAAGYRQLVLTTGSAQPEAVALYRSAGYEYVTPFGFYGGYPGNHSMGKTLSAPGTTAAPRVVEWVVLDLGETLVDETANWLRWAAYLQVPALTFLACLGATISQGRPHTEVFEIFRPGFDLAQRTAHREQVGLGWTPTASDLYPDALSSLAALRRAGYRVAVMANQPAEVAAFLATLPVDAADTSGQWGVAKPAGEFFSRVASELGAPAERVAYVGDRVDNDVLPARRAGMVAVHLRRGPWGLIQAAWPQAAQADVSVPALGALVEALRAAGVRPAPAEHGRDRQSLSGEQHGEHLPAHAQRADPAPAQDRDGDGLLPHHGE